MAPPQTPLIPPEQWRHLLRAILRECSYLPDPIARAYLHTHTIDRYRRYTNDANDKDTININNDILLQSRLHRKATHRLSFLKRANQGYTKPLERTLHIAYGRTGKRRRDLLHTYITPPPAVAPDTTAVTELLSQPAMFEDGWSAPPVVVELLRSQLRNPVVQRAKVRPVARKLEPVIPKENSWGRPVPRRRRVNIRRAWYRDVLESLLPPLPQEDWSVLHGLATGVIPWRPVVRRKPVGLGRGEASPPSSLLDDGFLSKGPSKEFTFGPYVDGRPHKLTPRFVRRLWSRVLYLVPRMSWDDTAKKHRFLWESPTQKARVPLSLPAGGASVSAFFHNIDDRGRLIRPQQSVRR